jgi:predicted amidophosphoribosyltransferase
MEAFMIERNQYLGQRVNAYYHTDYVGHRQLGNPDYINTLKNTYNNASVASLIDAEKQLQTVILRDFQQIKRDSKVDLTVCAIPRAKAENTYASSQMLFRGVVQRVGQQVGFANGTKYIVRHTDTKTTHLSRTRNGDMGGSGQLPYPGITTATCTLSPSIRGRNILLVDDIYTKTVNVDEDAIQALFSSGAHLVLFYAVARTVSRT